MILEFITIRFIWLIGHFY